MQRLDEIGYKSPTPIQAGAIPFLFQGRDLIGQAQTGTGKTAAFALPILSQINHNTQLPQVLILAPTRELAIQISDSFSDYAKYVKQFRISTIYGGQSYPIQIRQLRNGPSVIVGTPGRIIDHIEKGTLNLSGITHLVLDEADQMLEMGFIDDVELIINKTPNDRQTILFSATMPAPIEKIAQKYLKNPERVSIKNKTATATTIEQHVISLREPTKFDALVRLLETEQTDGVIIFTRTKQATVDISDKLLKLRYLSAALNGEMEQRQREATIEALKNGKLNILVATDVVARGLDVNRISHVINYDMPHNVDAYIHRIGRTGRAGRLGKAILFATKGEGYKLRVIERVTKQMLSHMEIPTLQKVREHQMVKIKHQISDVLAKPLDKYFSTLVTEYCKEHEVSEQAVASALAQMQFGSIINSLKDDNSAYKKDSRQKATGNRRDGRFREDSYSDSSARASRGRRSSVELSPYRIEVGHAHGITPKNIVGAIANEISLDSANIGDIRIFDEFSTVELPQQLPAKAMEILAKVRVAGHKLNISKSASTGLESKRERPRYNKSRRDKTERHREKV